MKIAKLIIQFSINNPAKQLDPKYKQITTKNLKNLLIKLSKFSKRISSNNNNKNIIMIKKDKEGLIQTRIIKMKITIIIILKISSKNRDTKAMMAVRKNFSINTIQILKIMQIQIINNNYNKIPIIIVKKIIIIIIL